MDSMGKFLVRITTIFVALYFLISYSVAELCGIDILDYTYTLLFELICLVYCFSEGNYHCKYLKYTMCGIFVADVITRLDYHLNLLTTDLANYIPITVLAIGMLTSTYKAIAHFSRVIQVTRQRNG